jgi:hypothetical protein
MHLAKQFTYRRTIFEFSRPFMRYSVKRNQNPKRGSKNAKTACAYYGRNGGYGLSFFAGSAP